MKLLYFGTICNLEAYDRRFEGLASKPSVAPIVFESALLNGFHQNGADIEIHSFPMIPAFPTYRAVHFGGITEQLPCGYSCRWLNTINLPVLKQFSRRLDARKALRRWLKAHREDGLILTYSIPPFLVKDVLSYAKKYGVKTAAIIPDLLRDMYINEPQDTFSYRLKQAYLAPALKLQDQYDGYIYLTEAMQEVVAPGKSHMIMEGIADTDHILPPVPEEKAVPRAIMYAGMLHEKYGILNLVDAFEKLDDKDAQLWLFGDGTAVPEIKKRAAANPNIRYGGTVSRESILTYERQATLLINPRDPDEEFTKFSFPSKTIEYMLSGTPLITTRLQGIPEEYFDFVFPADGSSTDALAAAMQNALGRSEQDLHEMGIRAQQFIQQEKNAARQAQRILTFLEGLHYES